MSKREVTEFDLRRPEFQDHRLTPDMFEFDATGDVVERTVLKGGLERFMACCAVMVCLAHVING